MDLVIVDQDLPFKVEHQFVFVFRSETTSCRHERYPLEIDSTMDIELNETSFLTFQVSNNAVGCLRWTRVSDLSARGEPLYCWLTCGTQPNAL